MTARAPRILLVGTAPEGRGRMAALVADGFARAIACLWRRPATLHAHAASHAGFARMSVLLWLVRCAGGQASSHLSGGGARQFATVRPGVPLRRWIRPVPERSPLVITVTEGWAGFVRGLASRARPGVRARTRVAQHDSTQAVSSRLAAIHNDLARA